MAPLAKGFALVVLVVIAVTYFDTGKGPVESGLESVMQVRSLMGPTASLEDF